MKKPVTTHSGKMKVIFALIIVLLLAATFLLNAVALVLSNHKNAFALQRATPTWCRPNGSWSTIPSTPTG